MIAVLSSIIFSVAMGATARASDPRETLLRCEQVAASPLDPARTPGVAGIAPDRIDTAAAVPACERAVAAAPGDVRANYHLGRALVAAKREADALRPLTAAAEAGLPLAQNNLGALLRDGATGVARDTAAAFGWLRKAADQGLAIAMFNVATAYRDGAGVAKDLSAALDWARTAAAAGFGPAREVAADLLESGEGIGGPRLADAAVFWRALTAEGDTAAAEKLGRAVISGQVRPLTPEEGEQALTRAFRQGAIGAGLALSRHLVTSRPQDAAARGRAEDLARRAYLMSRDASIGTEEAWLLHQREAAILLFDVEKAGPIGPETNGLMPELRSRFGKARTMKRFEVPVTCAQTTSKTFLYIWNWDQNEPQTDHQIRWLREARECTVAEAIAKSFRDLFAIARQHDQSFADLAANAMGEPGKPAPAPASPVTEQQALAEVENVRARNPSLPAKTLGFVDVIGIVSQRLGENGFSLDDAFGTWLDQTIERRWRPVVAMTRATPRDLSAIRKAAEAQSRADTDYAECQIALAKAQTLQPLFDLARKGAPVLDVVKIRFGLQRAIAAVCLDPGGAGTAAGVTGGALLKRVDPGVFAFRHADLLRPGFNPISAHLLPGYQKILRSELAAYGALPDLRKQVKATAKTSDVDVARRYITQITREGCPGDSRLCAFASLLPALDQPERYCTLLASTLGKRPIRNGSPKKDAALVADMLTLWVWAGVNHCRWNHARIAQDLKEWTDAGLMGLILKPAELGALGDMTMILAVSTGVEDRVAKDMIAARADMPALQAQFRQIETELRSLP